LDWPLVKKEFESRRGRRSQRVWGKGGSATQKQQKDGGGGCKGEKAGTFVQWPKRKGQGGYQKKKETGHQVEMGGTWLKGKEKQTGWISFAVYSPGRGGGKKTGGGGEGGLTFGRKKKRGVRRGGYRKNASKKQLMGLGKEGGKEGTPQKGEKRDRTREKKMERHNTKGRIEKRRNESTRGGAQKKKNINGGKG